MDDNQKWEQMKEEAKNEAIKQVREEMEAERKRIEAEEQSDPFKQVLKKYQRRGIT